jgi:hypothetical protein
VQSRRPVTNLAEVVRGGLPTGTLVGINEYDYAGRVGSRCRAGTGARRGAGAADRKPGSARPTEHEPMGGTEA